MTDRVVWVYGSAPAQCSEVVLVKESKLCDLIPAGKKVVADMGFRSLSVVVAPFGEDQLHGAGGEPINERIRHNKAVHRRRWKIEGIFSSAKNVCAPLEGAPSRVPCLYSGLQC